MNKKTMSAKQLEANRHNAQQSTGPKTPAGKAVSRRNAIKHGLSGESVVVQGHHYAEDPRQFDILCCELEQTLQPVGRLEKLFVERIAICVWRSRRVLQAENGEIRISADIGATARIMRRQFDGESMAREGSPLEQLSSPAVRCIVNTLERLRERVQADGRLTVEALHVVWIAFENRESGLMEDLRQFREAATAKTNGSGEPNGNTQHCQDVLAYLDTKIAIFSD